MLGRFDAIAPGTRNTQRARAVLSRQPPRMGEHSTEVLAEAGFNGGEIASLVASGTVSATEVGHG